MEHRTYAERVGDAITNFAGSPAFVLFHALFFAAWILLNTESVSPIKPIDPFPFTFLTFIVSLEAIFLTSFVLMSQTRLGRQSDRRAHLDLQLNILAEQELTKVLQILDRMCRTLCVPEPTDGETEELMKRTDVKSLAKELERKLNE